MNEGRGGVGFLLRWVSVDSEEVRVLGTAKVVCQRPPLWEERTFCRQAPPAHSSVSSTDEQIERVWKGRLHVFPKTCLRDTIHYFR